MLEFLWLLIRFFERTVVLLIISINDSSVTQSFCADRWDANKALIERFEEDFGERAI